MAMLTWKSPEVFGYARRMANRHEWKFRGELDRDDLMQEFAIAFIEVINMADPARGTKATMSLYKNKVAWLITDLSRKLHFAKRDISRKVSLTPFLERTVTWGSHRDDDPRFRFEDVEWTPSSHEPVLDLLMLIEESPATVHIYIKGLLTMSLGRENLRRVLQRLTGIQEDSFRRDLVVWGERYGFI